MVDSQSQCRNPARVTSCISAGDQVTSASSNRLAVKSPANIWSLAPGAERISTLSSKSKELTIHQLTRTPKVDIGLLLRQP